MRRTPATPSSSLSAVFSAAALATLALLGASVPGAQAQNVVVDEGTFALSRNGAEVGSEAFVIRRTGTGTDLRFYASATIEMDTGTEVLESNPKLQASQDREPMIYQNTVSGTDGVEVMIGPRDDRLLALTRTAAGEREREIRRVPGAVILEGTVVHQYFFLPVDLGPGATVPVIIPRDGRQVQGSVTSRESETIRVGSDAVDAVKLTLVVEGEERQVWRNGEGHVLRLVIPARNFRAERASL